MHRFNTIFFFCCTMCELVIIPRKDSSINTKLTKHEEETSSRNVPSEYVQTVMKVKSWNVLGTEPF